MAIKKIQLDLIEYDDEILENWTNILQKYFEDLKNTFSGMENFEGKRKKSNYLNDFTLCFSLMKSKSFSGYCDLNEKFIMIHSITLARDTIDNEISEPEERFKWYKGLIIHEFAHAFNWAWYGNENHNFKFQVTVFLLLAKAGLKWRNSLYNICESEKDTFNYTPAVLYKLCNYIVKKGKLNNCDDLRQAIDFICVRFDTRKSTVATQVVKYVREREFYRNLAVDEHMKSREQRQQFNQAIQNKDSQIEKLKLELITGKLSKWVINSGLFLCFIYRKICRVK
jgi:hypothetical protein